eukprot:scaffold27099_cov53-Phaeocystis_antarctica.AAC.1
MPWPPAFKVGPTPVHAADAAAAPRPSDIRPAPRPALRMPSFRLSAERKVPVRRKQAAYPLRMGGEFGLRLCWLWFDLGSGQLPVTASLAAASVAFSAIATAEPAALATTSVASATLAAARASVAAAAEPAALAAASVASSAIAATEPTAVASTA